MNEISANNTIFQCLGFCYRKIRSTGECISHQENSIEYTINNNVYFSLFNPDEVHGLSNGEVADKRGLFSPQIFRGHTKEGQDYPLGHIDLAVPVPHPLLFLGDFSAASLFLDKPDETILKIWAGLPIHGDVDLQESGHQALQGHPAREKIDR